MELIILLQEPSISEEKEQSALDILNSAPGKQVFQCAEDMEQYLHEERDAWEH